MSPTLPRPLLNHQPPTMFQKQHFFPHHPHHLPKLIPVFPLCLKMKSPRLSEAQEYGFQPGKLEILFQTPLNSLQIPEFHWALRSLPAATLHDRYFSWLGRRLHLSRTSLDSLESIKASSLEFQMIPSISHQHTEQPPLPHPHQPVPLRTSYLPTRTSAPSCLTTSSGCLPGRSLRLTEINSRS